MSLPLVRPNFFHFHSRFFGWIGQIIGWCQFLRYYYTFKNEKLHFNLIKMDGAKILWNTSWKANNFFFILSLWHLHDFHLLLMCVKENKCHHKQCSFKLPSSTSISWESTITTMTEEEMKILTRFSKNLFIRDKIKTKYLYREERKHQRNEYFKEGKNVFVPV